MPILRENRSRYPSNWEAIRKEILTRAGNCCEFCGVRNHTIGYRDCDGFFQPVPKITRQQLYLPPRVIGGPLVQDGVYLHRLFEIVLTIAHLNHQPEDNRPENLRALCQRCHLRYDAKHHAQTRWSKRMVVIEHVGQLHFHFGK